MKFAFNEEQEMLRDMVRGALQREVGIDLVRQWSDAGDSSPFDQFLSRNGWLGIGLAEEAGGQGGGLIEQTILFEEIGRCAAPSGTLLAGLAAVLAFAARAPGALELLQPLIQGQGSAALGVPAGRPADRATHLVRQGDGKLSGKIPLVLNAPGATLLLVPVADDAGVGLWLVEAKSQGVVIVPRRLIDRTRQFGDVSLHDAPAIRIGHLSQTDMIEVNARMAVLLAAESLGLARRMLEMTVEYVRQRVQFGVPVGSFQAVKHAAAEALVDIEATHAGVYYAAWALQEGEADALMHAWIAKAFATEAAVRTADRALQLHGAIGYTWEYDLQLFYKRAKLNLELFGSPRSYRERIANALSLH
jgi:alkylation response protein AidB-like acyl-CoA dehydrogenase